MTVRVGHRSWWSVFSIALIGFLMLSLMAACGSGDDDDDDSGSSTTATTSTGSSGSSSSATEAATADGTASMGNMSNMGEAMAIGACFQENTTGDIVKDLRDGKTDSAEGMYRDCLGDALPESMVSQLDPIIDQAGECGTDAAGKLSDDDVAAIEDGDQAKVESLTNNTLSCLSDDLGIDLQ